VGVLFGLGMWAVNALRGRPSEQEKGTKEMAANVSGLLSQIITYHFEILKFGEKSVENESDARTLFRFNKAQGIGILKIGWGAIPWFLSGNKNMDARVREGLQDAYDGIDLALNAKAVWGMHKASEFARTPVGRWAMRFNVVGGVLSTAFGVWDMSMDVRTIANATNDGERGEGAFDLVRDFGMTLGGVGLTLGGLAALGVFGAVAAPVVAPIAVGLAVGGLAVWGVATAVKWWDRRYNGGRLTESVGRGIRNGIAWVKSLPDRAVQTWRAVREAPGRVWGLVKQKVWEAAKDAGREAARRGIRWMTDKVKKFFQPKPTAK